jgi:predicted  nucleic acid-binding Zn-ribbon protein
MKTWALLLFQEVQVTEERLLVDQIRAMRKLQQVDLKTLELEIRLKTANDARDKAAAELAVVEEKLAADAKVMEEREARQRRQDGELDLEKANLKKWKSRLNASHSSRDSMMLVREIDSHERLIKGMEEDLLTLMEEIEGLNKNLEAQTAERDAVKSRLEEATKAAAEESAALSCEIENLKKERLAFLSEITPEVVGRYDFIRTKRQGLAVMPVKNGICTGCHMSISPHLFMFLVRGATLEACPSCQRIIYSEETVFGPEGEPTADGESCG